MTAVSEKPSATVDDTPQESAARARTWRSWAVAAAVPTALTGLHWTYYGQWIVDDAGLTFAYARSLATGAGPVLQPGAEPVEGYSNPAWLAVLTVGRWLGVFDQGTWFGRSDLVVFPKFAALVCCFGVFAAMFAIAAIVTARPVMVTLVAGSATAAVPSWAIWTTSGLENALFAFAVMAIAAVLARAVAAGTPLAVNTAVTTGVLAALAALTRPDGVAYAAAFPLAVVLLRQHHTWWHLAKAVLWSVVAFAAPVGIYLVWRAVTFGDYLPNTARAKEQGLPALADFDKPIELVGYVGWLTVLLSVAVVAVALSRPTATRAVLAVSLVPLGLAVLSYVLLKPDWMAQHRFATPVWPLAAIVVTMAAVNVLEHTSVRHRLVAGAVAVLAATLTLIGFAFSDKEFRAQPTVGVCNIAQNTGYLFNGYADLLGVDHGSLLAVDGGGTSLTTRLRFVDLSGLADRRIAQLWDDDDMPGLRDHVFDDVRPTFIKIYDGWAGRNRLALAQDERLARDYVLLRSGHRRREWVRRDAVPNNDAFAAAQQWGRHAWQLVTDRYRLVVPPVWWCGDTLRPTPFRPGVPAPSPMTPTA